MAHRKEQMIPSPAHQRPAIAIVAPFDQPQPGMVKIGEAARELGLSVQAIRLYEAEGLLISFKSKKGTRWYSRSDVDWIRRIHDLVGEGLNFAGIRRLLAQLPCWALKPCRSEDRESCSMRFEVRMPCWIAPDKLCNEQLKECYHCGTYRSARNLVDLKMHADIVPLQGA
jgi:MerR family transcriptional regulator/heat shock protein HspR